MRKILIVVDMQNDFIDGALGTPEAVAIVPKVEQKIREFPGKVIFTRDTHGERYLETQEGKHLPVPHCIKGTKGWEICPQLEALREAEAIDKVTFGSEKLGELLQEENRKVVNSSACGKISVRSSTFHASHAAFCSSS